MYRLLARDAGGETEGVLLNETVPAWVVDIVVEKKLAEISLEFDRLAKQMAYTRGHIYKTEPCPQVCKVDG